MDFHAYHLGWLTPFISHTNLFLKPYFPRKTRWSSPSNKSMPIFNDNNSLDSCLFEIFHSKDATKKSSPPVVDIKRPEKLHTSPPKKMKENHKSPIKSTGKLRTDRLKRKQRDIRYYFKKNSKVKIITYTDEIPMDASPVPLERSGNELDTMDIEYPNKGDLTEDFSDMEIEHFLKNEMKSQVKENSSSTTKISKSLSFDECLLSKAHDKKSNTKASSSTEKKEEEKRRGNSAVETTSSSSSNQRERSPLKLPSNEHLDKPVKFVRTLPLFNSRRILKPISLRFRRYTSMIEMSSSSKDATTPNFRKVKKERFVRTEPRNKRKVNRWDLFDELDKYDEPSSCKKARKMINTTSVSLPPPVQRIPLFKPSAELRCYGYTELGVQPLPTTKECESCCTSETVIWRDTEDGVSLCNACGIRWRKYHYRCIECWYIPMQDELDHVNCASCGKYNTLKKFSSLKRHKTSVL